MAAADSSTILMSEEYRVLTRYHFLKSNLVFVLFLFASSICDAQTPLPSNPDISNCDNCDTFPSEWLTANPEELIDFEKLSPERRLDFLIGDWELYFPNGAPGDENYTTADEPIGFETYEWYIPDEVIQADQYWGNKENPGFRARSDFRYIEDQERWQMTWLAPTAHSIFTGGYDGHGIFSFIEYVAKGDRRKVSFAPGMRYVFRNITEDQFVIEEWRQKEDGVGPFTSLRWRAMYRRTIKDFGQSNDEQDVKDFVELFLTTLGDGDLDAIPAMFASNANIGSVSWREGKWVVATKTFEEWFIELQAETTWTRFREPVAEFTVHIEKGQMAFVRADATYIVGDQVFSHNIDYFTLVRDGDAWKFLSASYVAQPVEEL
jgi:hypothetical protein